MLRLQRDGEAKIQTKVCLLCTRRREEGKDREKGGGRRAGSKLEALELRKLSRGGQGLCMLPSLSPKPQDL